MPETPPQRDIDRWSWTVTQLGRPGVKHGQHRAELAAGPRVGLARADHVDAHIDSTGTCAVNTFSTSENYAAVTAPREARRDSSQQAQQIQREIVG